MTLLAANDLQHADVRDVRGPGNLAQAATVAVRVPNGPAPRLFRFGAAQGGLADFADARDRRRVPGDSNQHRGRQLNAGESLRAAREAMEMPWANWRELSQAIPPAYTELIGHQLMAHIQARSAA